MMFKGIKKKELVAVCAIVALIGLLLVIFMYAGMRPGKGLRIAAPGQATFKTQTKTFGNTEDALKNIASASFMTAFGLDISPPVLPATQTQVTEVIQPPQPATPAAVIAPKPIEINLEKLGYRLKGIVFENGQSAAFIHIPAQKRVVIVRERSAGPVNLLEVGLRHVKLQTPEGTGQLNLESAKDSYLGRSLPIPASAPMPGQNQATEKNTLQPPPRQMSPEQTTPFAQANSIADQINLGALRVSQTRGKFSVEVRQVPEMLQNYDLKAGDQIIGTDAGEFTRSQDIATRLGMAGEKSHSLRVRRGQRVITIQAPQAPVKTAPKPGVASQSQTAP